MKSRSILFFLLTFSSAESVFASQAKTSEVARCESAKEFITTYEYLRDDSDVAGSSDNAVKVATQVAAGCTGSAKRFIQTLQFLKKVELPLQEILFTSVDFAKKEDIHVQAFKEIFKRTYAEDGFDLTIDKSLKISKEVAVEFSGNVGNALKDFNRISEFCSQADKVFLPRPDCAELAKRIALSGKESGPSASEIFLQAYQYLKNSVEMTAPDSLQLAEQLVAKDPQAFENFKLSYEYALSEKGLKSSKEQAIRFGQKMAALTVKESKNSIAK